MLCRIISARVKNKCVLIHSGTQSNEIRNDLFALLTQQLHFSQFIFYLSLFWSSCVPLSRECKTELYHCIRENYPVHVKVYMFQTPSALGWWIILLVWKWSLTCCMWKVSEMDSSTGRKCSFVVCVYTSHISHNLSPIVFIWLLSICCDTLKVSWGFHVFIYTIRGPDKSCDCCVATGGSAVLLRMKS